MNIAITGATSGIGLETARALLEKGHQLIFLVRNTEKAQRIMKDLPNSHNINVISCDLADLKSVQQAASALQKQTAQLDVLINNAGGTFTERMESKDGYELHLAVNHLGHFLLVKNAMEYLKKCQTKVINVSSEAHQAANVDFNDLNLEKNYSIIKGYGNAKLYNILLTKSLAERGLTSYALHPGVIDSGFGENLSTFLKIVWKLGKPFMKSTREGASTSIYLAINELDKEKNGQYFKDRKVASCSKQAKSESMREKLWQKSEDFTRAYQTEAV